MNTIEKIEEFYNNKIDGLNKEKNFILFKISNILDKFNYNNLFDFKKINFMVKISIDSKNYQKELLENYILNTFNFVLKEKPNLMLNNEVMITKIEDYIIYFDLIIYKPEIDIYNLDLFSNKIRSFINYEKEIYYYTDLMDINDFVGVKDKIRFDYIQNK